MFKTSMMTYTDRHNVNLNKVIRSFNQELDLQLIKQEIETIKDILKNHCSIEVMENVCNVQCFRLALTYGSFSRPYKLSDEDNYTVFEHAF